jgi:trk system potassium uptake protein TrkH
VSVGHRRPPRDLELNLGLVVPVVGFALLVVGLGMLACEVVALAYGDGAALAFALPGVVATGLGAAGVLARRRFPAGVLRARDGYFAVTAAWLLCSLVGAVPFLLQGTFASPVDALFESMSGFTGCGATVLADVEAEPHAVLLWRSLSQALGGVGIVVLVVAVAPAAGMASQRLFFAEGSSPTIERLTPRIADTAKIIWGVYLTLIVLGGLAYLLAGMGPFDALNHAFTTVGAGGFSTRTASIAAFDSRAVELVALVFMLLAGINLAFYWRVVRGRPLGPQLAEVRTYVLVVLGAVVLVSASVLLAADGARPARTVLDSAFAVATFITSTGFTTADFDGFPDFARLLLLGITFVGACAGSTSGGLKVSRIMLLARTGLQEVQRQFQPQAVQVLRLSGQTFSEDVRRTVLGLFVLWIAVWVLGVLALAAAGADLVTAASAACASLNLAGTGFGAVGSTESFAGLTAPAKAVMTALMLVGRLEVFTVVALLTPAFWRRQWA